MAWPISAGSRYSSAPTTSPLGFASTVFIAYFSSLTNAAYTATQYALFTSLMILPGKLLSGFSGVIVDSTDYVTFFLYASAMGVPSHRVCDGDHP